MSSEDANPMEDRQVREDEQIVGISENKNPLHI